MPSPRTLRVYPNPYLHVDADGRPCAVVNYEPQSGNDVGNSKRFVGMDLKVKSLSTAPAQSAQQDMQETWFEPSADLPVTVPETAYYQAAIRAGELIAADEATSRAIDSSKKHVDPAKALGEQRDLRAAWLKDQAHEHHDDRMIAALNAHAFGPLAAKTETTKPSYAPAALKEGSK